MYRSTRSLRLAFVATMGAGVLLASNAPFAQAQDRLPDLEFEQGTLGEVPPLGWFVPTAGWKAELVEMDAARGTRAVKLHLPGKSDAPFGNLMVQLDAEPFRGRHVKLTAKIRLDETKNDGRAQMWLRVDREGGEMGAFDNMGRRPITATTWTSATIEADIDADAQVINVGFMSLGSSPTVYVDDVSLVITGDAKSALPKQPASAPAALSDRGTQNLIAAARLFSYIRFFHPSDQAAGVKAWDHLAVRVMEQAEPAADAKDLAERLKQVFEPIAPTLQVWAGDAAQAPALPPAPEGATATAQWRHLGAGSVGTIKGNAYQSRVERTDRADKGTPSGAEYAESFLIKELGGGVSVRFATRVFADAEGTLPHGKPPEALAVKDGGLTLTAGNRSTRLAAVTEAWGIFQHFYPYFDVVQTDWAAALEPALRKAATDKGDSEFLFTLRTLVSQLHDGHGHVMSASARPAKMMPIAVEWLGHDLVVVGKHASVTQDVRTGDVVIAIDGKPTEDVYKEVSTWISAATDGWGRYFSTSFIVSHYPTADPVTLTLRHLDGTTSSATLARVAEFVQGSAIPNRPQQGAEIAPGIVYFNLDGARLEALESSMSALAAAKGIIFDMRGYPGDAAYGLMQHLIDEPATSAKWNVPIVRKPDGDGWEWSESGRWQLEPKAPRLMGKVAFLTDGRAISYAESIMGIVEAYKFGEIVGSTTAGTNGNINPFALPGGYTVSWTGMRVLKHDGSRHHGVGIAPTIPVTPTAQGVADGKDEVLLKAIEVIGKQITEAK